MKRIALLPLLALLVPSACGGDSFTNAVVPAEPTPVDAGAAAPPPEPSVITGGKKEAPPGCDAAQLPTKDPCVIDEGLGIFVSKSLGKDDGDGTRAKPFATLNKAITIAAGPSKRVYACAETYAESVTLAEGVSLFGYFNCAAGWTVDATKRATVTAATSPAFKAQVKTAQRVEAFEFKAGDATQPSGSSIAAIVVGSPSLTFENVLLKAGNGHAGADGVAGIALTDSPVDDRNGKPGNTAGKCALSFGCPALHAGGLGGVNTCTGVANIKGGYGGNGGSAARYGRFFHDGFYDLIIGLPGGDGDAQPANGDTARGGVHDQPSVGGNGGDGAPGTHGVSATSNIGNLSAVGFTPADGTAGTDGKPGQGGGGGGSHTAAASTLTDDSSAWYGYSGSGGGAGGCPGLAGSAGKGGGASIGMIAIQSGLTLRNSIIEAGDGGAGGIGTLGSEPTFGGAGGSGLGLRTGAAGGAGGWGGTPGVSGHGAGGPSIGLAYKETTSDLGGMTPKAGKPGKGRAAVPSNTLGTTRTIPASVDGAAHTTFVIP